MIRSVVILIVELLVLGLIGWAVNQFPEFFGQTILKLIRVVLVVVAVIFVCLFLVGLFGVGSSFHFPK